MLSMHVDGSYVYNKKGGAGALGAAIVAVLNGVELEIVKACTVKGKLRSSHEYYAVLEGVLLAMEHGIAPEQVTLYTDDDILGYAPTFLHPENLCGPQRDCLIRRMTQVCEELYPELDANSVITFLSRVTAHKLKGHNLLVYQERADYLARDAAWAKLREAPREAVSFEAWLKKGMRLFKGTDRDVVKWTAPFVVQELEMSV